MRIPRSTCLVVTAAAVAAVILAASGAWACIPGSGGGSGKKLSVTPAHVQPGDRVTVTAASAGQGAIEVRLDGTDGPLLGTLSGDRVGTAAGGSSATFAVPLTTPPGRHALIAVQAGAKWDPAVLAVARPDGTVPESPAPAGLAGSGSSQGRGPMAIVLGVVALTLVAAIWSVRARRQRTGPLSPIARGA